MSLVEIRNLCVSVEEKPVLKDINLEFDINEVNVFLGPNGAGKSTLANILMGNPKYKVTQGKIFFNGEDITNLESDKRAKLGLFLSFQSPFEIEGVTFLNFLRSSYNFVKDKDVKLKEFIALLDDKMSVLSMDKKVRSREVNVGFSGGEKKKAEILQLLLLEPKFAILDEVDSGLDVDALKLIGKAIGNLKYENQTGFMIITHNNKILEYLNPDRVFVLVDGSISQVGGSELIDKIESEGFNKFS